MPAPPVRNSIFSSSICWLPPFEERFAAEGLEKGCCDHPILILGVQEKEGRKETGFLIVCYPIYFILETCLIVTTQITSFGGKLLHEKYDKPRERSRYLPIAPSPAHPDNDKILELDGDPLKYKSYVNIGEIRRCSMDIVQPRKKSFRSQLRPDSYMLLIDSLLERLEDSHPNVAMLRQWQDSYAPSFGVSSHPSPAQHPRLDPAPSTTDGRRHQQPADSRPRSQTSRQNESRDAPVRSPRLPGSQPCSSTDRSPLWSPYWTQNNTFPRRSEYQQPASSPPDERPKWNDTLIRVLKSLRWKGFMDLIKSLPWKNILVAVVVIGGVSGILYGSYLALLWIKGIAVWLWSWIKGFPNWVASEWNKLLNKLFGNAVEKVLSARNTIAEAAMALF
jgi:hypothetical protein